MRSSTDAWAVGNFTGPDADDDGLNMLTEHWNGSTWSQVPTPAVLHLDESLLAVGASSASDAWAVGFTKGVGAAGRFPVAAHWNGSSWTIVPTPTQSGGSKSTLNGVVDLGPADAWAVGRSRSATALVEHWNGTAWSIVPSRNATTSNLLTGVAAVAANNVWAVGYTITTDGTNEPDRTLIEHWNGISWSIVASPSPASNDTLTGVAARSASDVWAVGTRQDHSGAIPINRTLTEHWNGSAWSVVASPNVGANDNLLNAVAAVPGDVWAVGSSEVFDHTLVLRETG